MLKKSKIANWPKEDNQDKAAKIILFLISPFLAALYSVRTLNRKSSYVVFYLFAVFFGMAFTISKTHRYDGSAYRNWFEEISLITSVDFYDQLAKYLTFQGKDVGAKKDFFFDIVSFYISRITDNYHVMFMVFAAIFAFFALKSFRFFTKEVNFKIDLIVYILVCFFMINQIFNINGLRFWTAAWIGVYCIFQIFRNKNKRYFILLLFIPVIHASYWVFIGVVILAYFFRKYEKIWVVLFFSSFILSSITVEILNTNLDLLPSIIRRSAEKYASTDYIEFRSGGSGFYWVGKTMRFLVRFYFAYLIYLFIKERDIILKNPKTKSIFLFLLVFMTFVNLSMPVPSFGSRYMGLAYPIIAYIWIVNFKNIKYKRVIYLLPFIYWFQIYTVILQYTAVINFGFFFTNPISLVYKYLIAA